MVSWQTPSSSASSSSVPDGFSCLLPAGDDPVVLPRLGILLPASGGSTRLIRVGRNVLQVEDGDGPATTVRLDDIPAAARLSWLPVGRDDSARLLWNSHPALFPGSYAANVSTNPPDPAGHAAMITAALELIREVDPRRGEQIATGIMWYAPLISPSLEIHRSRTAHQPARRPIPFPRSGQSVAGGGHRP